MSIILYGVDHNVARDPYLTQSGTESTADMALPVDFSDAAVHTIISRTIPGGVMGANGYVVADMFGAFTNPNARSVSADDGIITKSVSQNLVADTWYFQLTYVVQNYGSEATQVRHWHQDYGRQAGSNSDARYGQLSTTDTASDWTLALTVQSSSVATVARVDAVRVQTFYLP